MALVHTSTGPAHPRLGRATSWILALIYTKFAAWRGYFRASSVYASERGASFRRKLEAGEQIYLLGLGAGGHNSGAALVRCSKAKGIELLANDEEERYSGIKHCTDFPVLSLQAINRRLHREGQSSADLHACLGTWDYPAFAAETFGAIVAEAPRSWAWMQPRMHQGLADATPLYQALWHGTAWLRTALELKPRLPIVGLRHHDCHASYSYACSPFAGSSEATMVAVLDGAGDTGAISLYEARGSELRLVYDNRSFFDSLGHVYSIISATQGGWTPLSSEGRYMGAAAWGNSCRLTNPYYMRLRQIFHFGADGQIFLNRRLARWHLKGFIKPYSDELTELLGPAIDLARMWDPDAILSVDDVVHSEITRERVDKAAALQLVFEDALCHIIGAFIQKSGSHQLVLTGGCALNCVANMRLLDHFGEGYFDRYRGEKNTRLHLWVPPNPGDAGVTIGAAYAFAMQHGAPLGPRLSHAFYCGDGPTDDAIAAAVDRCPEVAWVHLGNGADSTQRDAYADLLAFLIAQGAVMGLVQGSAETGPRALGHRSILANPCHPRMLEHLNAVVKHRERVRPLAPMATLAAAKEYFELQEGASDDAYGAYNFMVLTAKAKPAARTKVPAVVHEDGTSRVQIVRAETDPFTHAFLQAMGRRVGVEMAVNTSLNIGSPIVQTPLQAVTALRRSKGLDGIVMLTASGAAWIAYDRSIGGRKDGGQRLRQWISNWQSVQPADTDGAMALDHGGDEDLDSLINDLDRPLQ